MFAKMIREIIIEALLHANTYDEGDYIYDLISDELKRDPEIVAIYKEKKTIPLYRNMSSSNHNEEDDDFILKLNVYSHFRKRTYN